MKNMIMVWIVVFALDLWAPQIAYSQGTLYVSSLGQPTAGIATVGSDSWEAAWIRTGGNPAGYALDSVQVDMAAASGTPNDFSVMLYSSVAFIADFPGSRLGTLSGSSDPVVGGLYTYSASGLTLSPSTDYYIVLTTGSAIASGAFAWNYANSLPNSSGGWSGSYYLLRSSDGSSWSPDQVDPLFAVTATAVPEPSTLTLLGLPGLVFLAWSRLKGKARIAASR